MSGLEQTKCPWSPEPLVHDAFGDALTVEMRHPLKEKEVVEDYGAAGAGSERVLVIAYGASGVRCRRLAYFVNHAIVQDLRSKGGSAEWKPNPLSQGESDPEEVANKAWDVGRHSRTATARESTPHRVASSRIAAILAAHAANGFKYGNTCPRERQLAQLPFVVVAEEHLQLD